MAQKALESAVRDLIKSVCELTKKVSDLECKTAEQNSVITMQTETIAQLKTAVVGTSTCTSRNMEVQKTMSPTSVQPQIVTGAVPALQRPIRQARANAVRKTALTSAVPIMTGEALAAMSTIESTQAVLALFHATLAITGYMCPTDADISTVLTMSMNGQFDYVIVGAGSAGSVLARRLTECPNVNVLLLEAGGCPPLESVCPGYFTLQPETAFDYNMTAKDDGFSCQYLQGNSVGLTVGKMIGGSSSLQHMLHVVGDKCDFQDWCRITGNSTWSYKNVLPYFKKQENLIDLEIMEKYGSFHGTSGPMILKRQTSPDNVIIMDAFEEMGIEKRIDTNNVNTLGVVEPLLNIGEYLRQDGFTSYIRPVKERPNLFVLTGATVSKVLFNEINAATGVQFTKDSNIYTVNGREIILSAGAIKTPQILMLSGVGDPDHLTSVGITPRVNNVYVGENLQDHVTAAILIGLEQDNSVPPPQNPFLFPAPTTNAFVAINRKQEYADYLAINLLFPNNSTGLMQFCLKVVKYKPEICQKMYEGNIGRKVMFSVPHNLNPRSKGFIRLNNTDINTQPIVHLNLLNDTTDVENLAKYLAHFSKILDTTNFKSIGAEFIDLGVCGEHTYGTDDFWKCYGVAFSTTLWHFCSTCAIGTCLDNSFNVQGTSNLKVVDASAMPKIIHGKINAAVVMLAEKAADVIKIEHGLSCSAD